MPTITYAQAIQKGFTQLLEQDEDVFVLGQGLWSPWYVGSTMTDIDKRFGRERILDTPVSENATTGAAIGAAIAGKRPIVVHPRMDFALLAMDPIINQASNWSYLFAGQVPVPMVIRAIVNRGGEQGAQHSQALQSFFLHVPGVKVVMPATPGDARDLLAAAVYDGNPVIYIDDRWLYEEEGEVSEELTKTTIGRAAIRRVGDDITVVASSYMVTEALASAEILENRGISVEVIDLRSIKPWDADTVCESVLKTGRLVVADTGWIQGGISAEVASTIGARAHGRLKSPILRIGLPNSPAPCARTLEEAYYPRARTVSAAVAAILDEVSVEQLDCCTPELPGMIGF